MIKVDSHNHSTYSHDAVCSPHALCKGAVASGLTGIVISDHADVQDYKDIRSMLHIVSSVGDARRAAAEFEGKLQVFAGVEFGEAVWNPAVADELISIIQPDAVLSSVHAVRFGEHTESFSRLDFTHWTDETLRGYMVQYFTDMQEMIEKVDMDILPHLSNPLKYINGKYNKGVSLKPYSAAIDKILKTVIEKQIALELNLALIGTRYSELMPTADVLRRYKELGGSLVTLGSDAHVETRVGVNFDFGIKTLWDCGFTSYNYYKDRKCHSVKIGE